MYERVCDNNRWDPTMMLANVIFYLRGTAKQWYDTHEADLTSWDVCKEKMRDLFGRPVGRQLAAKKELACRAQTSTESYVVYIQDVLALYRKADDNMTEADKIGHILKAMKIVAFISVLIHGSLAGTSVIRMPEEALLSKDANLPLPDQHFNITITGNFSDKVFMFNLTHGHLHTVAKRDNSRSGKVCTTESGDALHVTCRVATAGWCAKYDGVVYNGTDQPEEKFAESFNVTVTIEKYESPLNPADVTVYIRVLHPPSGEGVNSSSTYTTQPEIAEQAAIALAILDSKRSRIHSDSKPAVLEFAKALISRQALAILDGKVVKPHTIIWFPAHMRDITGARATLKESAHSAARGLANFAAARQEDVEVPDCRDHLLTYNELTQDFP
nr:uncharacterized protein LOC129386782 [Dermacentor andersoni]